MYLLAIRIKSYGYIANMSNLDSVMKGIRRDSADSSEIDTICVLQNYNGSFEY